MAWRFIPCKLADFKWFVSDRAVVAAPGKNGESKRQIRIRRLTRGHSEQRIAHAVSTSFQMPGQPSLKTRISVGCQCEIIPTMELFKEPKL
jgi:hypothetical protein